MKLKRDLGPLVFIVIIYSLLAGVTLYVATKDKYEWQTDTLEK